jgi:hypothetical protein
MITGFFMPFSARLPRIYKDEKYMKRMEKNKNGI